MCPSNNGKLTSDDSRLIYIHGLIYTLSKLRNEVIRRHYDILIYSHQGTKKTIEHISRNYYFLNIRRKVLQYIQQCDIYQQNKLSRHTPYRELQILEVPTRSQEQITIDFITKLLESNGYNIIIVVVKRLTKYSYMILTTEKILAREIASILLRVVFTNYRISKKITSDRDKLFTNKMW